MTRETKLWSNQLKAIDEDRKYVPKFVTEGMIELASALVSKVMAEYDKHDRIIIMTGPKCCFMWHGQQYEMVSKIERLDVMPDVEVFRNKEMSDVLADHLFEQVKRRIDEVLSRNCFVGIYQPILTSSIVGTEAIGTLIRFGYHQLPDDEECLRIFQREF